MSIRAESLTKLAQILARAPVRPVPRQAISRPTLSSPRQFGTSIRSNGKPTQHISSISFLSGSRIGAVSLLSSQSRLLANRRFASTDSTTPTSSAEHTTPSSPSPEPDFSTFSDLEVPSILNVPETLGYLANLGLDYGHGPTSACQWVVEQLHFTMGFGWLGAIVGASVLLRLAMAYPALLAQNESHKSQEMRKDPVYQALQQKFLASMAQRGGVDNTAELMQQRMQLKYIEAQHGVKKSRMFFPMLQIPFAYGLFKLTRGMALLPVPGLETAGALWFTDLTVADPLYILPSVGALLMYLSMRVSRRCRPPPPSPYEAENANPLPFQKRALPFMAKEQATFMKFMPFILGPITFIVTLNFPAAVQIYFATAAILQYVQTTIWHIPAVRSLCGLPPLETTIINPEYQKSPASPFANRQGIYQAPRTVNTTATEQKADEEQKGMTSPFAMFRDARKQVGESLSSFKRTAAQVEKDAAVRFEKRRIQEDHDRYVARKGDARKQQQQQHKKKSEKK